MQDWYGYDRRRKLAVLQGEVLEPKEITKNVVAGIIIILGILGMLFVD